MIDYPVHNNDYKIGIRTPALTLKIIYWASIGGSPPKPKNADTLGDVQISQSLWYESDIKTSNIRLAKDSQFSTS
jgi:hypothetical protein